VVSTTKLTALRLPIGLLERIEALARTQGIKLSAAMRIALQRGAAAMEHDAKPAPSTPPPVSRRKMISKGVI
jgi:hypothetical protein